MPRKYRKPEQVINLLRQAEIMTRQGMDLDSICRQLQISTKTYYRWRKMYGGMQTSQVKSFKRRERKA